MSGEDGVVDESDRWDDPLELRIRLDIALERIDMLEGELADLRAAARSASTTAPVSAHAPPIASTLVEQAPRDDPAEPLVCRRSRNSPAVTA
jgi:hypothetical protein